MAKQDKLVVGLLAAAASLLAFLYYYRHGSLLLYGDAVAHINIARRVFDSLTPGPREFGTVWLPLPHVLILPFVIPLGWWQSGVGGSIYAMAAYVLGAAGIFRLAFRLTASRAAAWVAFLVFAGNPNLLYMQATAMTESLYLALFIWATVYFADYVEESRSGDEDAYRRATRAITRCGWCVAGMVLTRYDGWFVGPFFVGAAIVVLFRRRGTKFLTQRDAPLWRGVRNMAVISAAAPVFWLVYNWALNGHPLDFALGPYSAKAIEERTSTPGVFHPGHHDLGMAWTFFRKCAELTLTDSTWHHALFYAAIVGVVLGLIFHRRSWPGLFLWLPWPFYALSIAYGSIPLFMPVWWPFTYYNVRYGLQLLPAIALGVAGLYAAPGYRRFRYSVPADDPSATRKLQVITLLPRIALAVYLIVIAAIYVTAWRATPITLREAEVNSRARLALESEMAKELQALPADATLLMFIGEHGGALQRAGIPLRRTINETTHRHGELPNGLWERALADPARYADYAVAFGGDAVAQSAAQHSADLTPLVVVHTAGQPPATIYRVHRR
ncbi:MAG TPA: hypothetical protein VL382_04680 [Terriglobales bacterium]|nr:hypothetical protein [Terriglobales bacterium]